MRPLRQFREFMDDGKVKRQAPDTERSKALFEEAREKKALFDKVIAAFGMAGVTPNFIIENVYDVLMELVRARLFQDGYNPEASHEAEIAYLRLLNVPESDVAFLNELRYHRNGIKYYGKRQDREYAAKAIAFMKKAYADFERLAKGVKIY